MPPLERWLSPRQGCCGIPETPFTPSCDRAPTRQQLHTLRLAGGAGFGELAKTMKGIRKGESRAKESKLREHPGPRRCARCGRLDLVLMLKKMGLKSGFMFWNLVFLWTVSCAKGRFCLPAFGGPPELPGEDGDEGGADWWPERGC